MTPEPPPSPSSSDIPSRLHTTIRVNQLTLRFHDRTLEEIYKANTHTRRKALWLRSLIPAAGSQILFAVADSIEHPQVNLPITLAARLFLIVLQIGIFLLVKYDLIKARERSMFMIAIANGVSTLLLYTLQRSSLGQWDSLFVVFGLSFYTIPKITPLGFVSSCVGSWIVTCLYVWLSFWVRPPVKRVESMLGLCYIIPVVGIFNTIAYFSEYAARERFVLRRKLTSESISLAVARIKDYRTTCEASTRIASVLLGLMLWGICTIGGWMDFPDQIKFVTNETGWAWFSHCAGLTAFVVIMTRQIAWLAVIPILGSVMLWLMTLAIPDEKWIIISAHSVGYGLLFASMLVALGVFGRFVCAWKELISFVTRSCFLYPQLQQGLEADFPMLEKIVSEYTAGFDPTIMNSRGGRLSDAARDTTAVMAAAATIVTGGSGVVSPSKSNKVGKSSPRQRRPIRQNHSSTSPQRADDSMKIVPATSEVKNACTKYSTDRDVIMISVLPSFKAGKCFFCSKHATEHMVPVCSQWGKWTHWRMDQDQLVRQHIQGTDQLKRPVRMCTTYQELSEQKLELLDQKNALEIYTNQLKQELECQVKEQDKVLQIATNLRTELRIQNEKHAMEMQRLDAAMQAKVDQMQHEMNCLIRERKLETKAIENQRLTLEKQAQSQVKETKEQVQLLIEKNRLLRDEIDSLEAKSKAQEPEQEHVALVNSPTEAVEVSETSEELKTIPTSRRLPYARALEIEGMRESIRRKSKCQYQHIK